ncbi:MAG TPA: flagellar biosynthesis protein FlhF [Candidatus Hydrogenedentes bacterium]|nr:flagellar biosynthesis protein FlhF [Candidatus Hydrogenedentota bacterium]
MRDTGQRFHKFKARTLEEAYRQMRDTLGQDAVMLRAAQVRETGVLGLLGGKAVELTASAGAAGSAGKGGGRSAAERRYEAAAKTPQREEDASTVAYFQELVRDAQRRMGMHDAAQTRYRTVGNAAPKPVEEKPSPGSIIPFRRPDLRLPAHRREEGNDLRKEVHDVREMLEVLVAELPGAGLPVEFGAHYRNLLERGVSRKVAARLVAAVTAGADFAVIRDARVFAERLGFEIRKLVSVTGGIGLVAGGCRVVALVGATGVGKTTNLAKLAAQFVVRESARVAFVTADTYRVAAPEQLRVYANIIGVPLEVANDGKEMVAAIRRFRDYDLVLMDTAGASQFNMKQTRELAEVLKLAQPNETMLVVSANTQFEELMTTVRNLDSLNPTSLFFSKLDETRRYGALFSLAAETGLPLSYMSVGQNVPDDITLAHPGMVANLVLEGGDRRGRSSAKSTGIH